MNKWLLLFKKKKARFDKSNIANYSCHHPTLGEGKPEDWGPTPEIKAAQQEVAHYYT